MKLICLLTIISLNFLDASGYVQLGIPVDAAAVNEAVRRPISEAARAGGAGGTDTEIATRRREGITEGLSRLAVSVPANTSEASATIVAVPVTLLEALIKELQKPKVVRIITTQDIQHFKNTIDTRWRRFNYESNLLDRESQEQKRALLGESGPALKKQQQQKQKNLEVALARKPKLEEERMRACRGDAMFHFSSTQIENMRIEACTLPHRIKTLREEVAILDKKLEELYGLCTSTS